MGDSFVDPTIEASDISEDVAEYSDPIENDAEIELEGEFAEEIQEELVQQDTRFQKEELDEFSRYERSYRARRIRELTRAPLKKEKRPAKTPSDGQIAA